MMFCMRDTLKNWQTLSHWRLECNLKSDLFWTASTDHETDQEKVNIDVVYGKQCKDLVHIRKVFGKSNRRKHDLMVAF